MSKVCLCYRPLDHKHPYIEHWDFFLMPRSEVDHEERLDPTIQQIIPYATFFRIKETVVDGQPAETLEMLSYSRGKKSNEGRLVDQRSVGWGGHIDHLPGDNILELLHDETAREIEEELGITVNSKKLYAAIIGCIRNFSFLRTDKRPVDSVHTGLSLMLNIDEHLNGQEFKLEEGKILDPRWVSIEGLTADEMAEYEEWSKIVIMGWQSKINETRVAALESQRLLANQTAAAQARAEVDALNATSAADPYGALTLSYGEPLQQGETVDWNYDHTAIRPEPLEGTTEFKLHPLAQIETVTELTLTRGLHEINYVFKVISASEEQPEDKRLVLIGVQQRTLDPQASLEKVETLLNELDTQLAENAQERNDAVQNVREAFEDLKDSNARLEAASQALWPFPIRDDKVA